jgi:hypothetical protein
MDKQALSLWQRLRRFVAKDPGRFSGGTSVIAPFQELAVERERLTGPSEPEGGGSDPMPDSERADEAT